MKYKFEANPSAPTTMKWHEVFVPENDPDTPEDESLQIQIVRERTWQLTAQANESHEFEIDPSTEQRGDGYYTIMMQPVHLGVDGIGEAGKDVSGQDSTPGKVVLVNDGDADRDAIPDYADGYDFDSQVEDDDSLNGASFTPVYLGVYAADPAQAKIRFTYDASAPTAITRTATNPYQLPANGKLRLWTKDAWGGYDPDTYEQVPRNPDSVKNGGDFIEPGVEYTFEELGIYDYYGWYFNIYAELVKVSGAVADIPIKVEVDPTGNMGFVWSDQVRFTATKITLEGRSSRLNEFREIEAFTTSRLRSDPTQTPLVVGQDLLSPAYQEFRIAISDPRGQHLSEVRVIGQTLSLTVSGDGRSNSEPFVLRRMGQSPNVQGIPTKAILAANGASRLDYNPLMDFRTETRIRTPNTDEKGLAREIDNVVNDLHSSSWTPPPEKYSPLDDGAFGKEVHERVGNKYRGKSGWLVNAFFEELEDGNWRFVGVELADRQGKTEVDIMRLKRGYHLRPNSVINRDMIEFITDIKNTASGKLDFAGAQSQGQRLLRLAGDNPSKLRVLVPVQRWTRSVGWRPNKKFAALGSILFLGGIADTTFNVLHAEQFDQEFDEIVSEARRINGLMGQDYDLIVKPQLIAWQVQVHNYLSHFMVVDEPLTLVSVVRIYQLMRSESWAVLQYDPEEEE